MLISLIRVHWLLFSLLDSWLSNHIYSISQNFLLGVCYIVSAGYSFHSWILIIEQHCKGLCFLILLLYMKEVLQYISSICSHSCRLLYACAWVIVDWSFFNSGHLTSFLYNNLLIWPQKWGLQNRNACSVHLINILDYEEQFKIWWPTLEPSTHYALEFSNWMP